MRTLQLAAMSFSVCFCRWSKCGSLFLHFHRLLLRHVSNPPLMLPCLFHYYCINPAIYLLHTNLILFENQSKHRQKMEEIKFRSESRDGLLGIIFAFVLGISCIIVAAIIVILVPKSAGAIFGSLLGITGIGSIIATFITSTHSHSNHDQKR